MIGMKNYGQVNQFLICLPDYQVTLAWTSYVKIHKSILEKSLIELRFSGTTHVGFASNTKYYQTIFKNTNCLLIWNSLSDKSMLTFLGKKVNFMHFQKCLNSYKPTPMSEQCGKLIFLFRFFQVSLNFFHAVLSMCLKHQDPLDLFVWTHLLEMC